MAVRKSHDRTKVLLQERMNEYKTGLFVTEVNLQQAQPPEPVQAAFARRDQVAKTSSA